MRHWLFIHGKHQILIWGTLNNIFLTQFIVLLVITLHKLLIFFVWSTIIWLFPSMIALFRLWLLQILNLKYFLLSVFVQIFPGFRFHKIFFTSLQFIDSSNLPYLFLSSFSFVFRNNTTFIILLLSWWRQAIIGILITNQIFKATSSLYNSLWINLRWKEKVWVSLDAMMVS